MNEEKLFLSRRGFIGAMSAVVAMATIPKLTASATPSDRVRYSASDEEWLTVSAMVVDDAPLNDRMRIEGECRKALRAEFRKRGLRPVGKPRRHEEYSLDWAAVIIRFDQIGVRLGHRPKNRLPE